MTRFFTLAALFAGIAIGVKYAGRRPRAVPLRRNLGAPTTGNQPTDLLPHGGMAPYGTAGLRH